MGWKMQEIQRLNKLKRYDEAAALSKNTAARFDRPDIASPNNDYVVQKDESWFSIAQDRLRGASASQIAAYAQALANANGGMGVLRGGAHIRLPGAVVERDATPTGAFWDAAMAQSALGGYKPAQALVGGGATGTVAPAATRGGGTGQATGSLPAPAPLKPIVPQSSTPAFTMGTGPQAEGYSLASNSAYKRPLAGLTTNPIPGTSQPGRPFQQGQYGASFNTLKPISPPSASAAPATPAVPPKNPTTGFAPPPEYFSWSPQEKSAWSIANAIQNGTQAQFIAIDATTQATIGWTDAEMTDLGFVKGGGPDGNSWVVTETLLEMARDYNETQAAATGNGSGVSEDDLRQTIRNYNYNKRDPYGVSPYRPRRGGGNGDSGTAYDYYPRQQAYNDFSQSGYDEYGQSRLYNWRIGF